MHRDRSHRDVAIFELFGAGSDGGPAAPDGRTGRQPLLTLAELGRACRVDVERLSSLVDQGVLAPSSGDGSSVRFDDRARRRAHLALRLSRDLEPGPAGAALLIELIDRIDALGSELRHLSQS